MQAKIAIGIIIGLFLVIGIGAFAVTTTSNETNIEPVIETESTTPDEGKNFILILRDDIQSKSQP